MRTSFSSDTTFFTVVLHKKEHWNIVAYYTSSTNVLCFEIYYKTSTSRASYKTRFESSIVLAFNIYLPDRIFNFLLQVFRHYDAYKFRVVFL